VPLVYACIAPHGGETIPALAGDSLRLFEPTRIGMRVLARQVKEARPDTIVIASPHNLRLPQHIGVVISEYSSGQVVEGTKRVRLRVKCDVKIGRGVIDEAERRGLPVVGANYGALEGPMSDLAMDWGTLIPLWFFLKENRLKSKVLIVTPSRGIPLEQNHEFGRCIAKVAESSRKRVVFVASSDQAHAHRRDGPYGFDAHAKVYDKYVLRAVEGGRLSSVMRIDQALVEAAKPDSLWQLAVLAGVLDVVPMKGRLVSYQVPTYYGMLCAGYTLSPKSTR
jgi:aromatic ring-opening dioxygenase LigB subunit